MRLVLPLFLLALLAACGPNNDVPLSSSTEASVMSEEGSSKREVQQETGNVSYRGVVEPLGISLYMQGTHRLALDNDRFVLLEGPAVDLNAYVGEEVEVFGAVRPTVEAGGVIMRVERVRRTVVRSEVSSSVSSGSSEVSSLVSLPASRLSVGQAKSSPAAVVGSSQSSVPLPSSSIGGALEQDGKTAAMAKEKFSQEQWTQEYCSTHVSFCFPVHRNWWFKSFGATASSLWHVEVSSEPVENLGDGVLLVNLVQGGLAASGATDREVRMHGNFAVGYRSFSENRHFEISAPMDLKAAVEYMTENLR